MKVCLARGNETKCKKRPQNMTGDVGLSAESEIYRVMKSVFDGLQQEIWTQFRRLISNLDFYWTLDIY